MTEKESEINKLREIISTQQHQIELLQEQIKLLITNAYGKKSEKKIFDPGPNQLSFLDDPEAPPVPKTPEVIVQVPAYTKKKGRKAIPENLPRVEIIHDIPAEEKQCECGTELSRIGEEVSEQLNYIPAKLEVIRHIRPKYACKACEGTEADPDSKTVKIAPAPKQILPKTIASAGLLAHIITAKCVDALPFYRQEQQFKRLGYKVSRTNMVNWTISLADKLKILGQLLKKEIRSGPLIHMDETTLQVLKEPGRASNTKSYIWVMRTGASKHPGIYFHYSPTRSASVANQLLTGYEGTILTDGYAGYDNATRDNSKINHAGCWAHARRHFADVIKALGQTATKDSLAEEAIIWIRHLYQIEKEILAHQPELNPDQIKEVRTEKSVPLLKDFHQWLQSKVGETPPKGLMGKAISYALNQWDKLTLYVDHGDIPIDNNPAENAIRPFVLGRKNFLFSDSVKGAEATALFYSLTETAKANDLNPTEYLKTLFEKLPHAKEEAEIKSLLPQYLNDTTSN